MRVWRLSREPYCRDRVGLGARAQGGRWSPAGTGVLYCSSARSLAALEYLAHIGTTYPRDLVLVALDLPDSSIIEQVPLESLPESWQSPLPSTACQAWGAAWVASNRSLGIAVPSVIVPEERNVVLNTNHAEMASVTLTPIRRFHFDLRLLKP